MERSYRPARGQCPSRAHLSGGSRNGGSRCRHVGAVVCFGRCSTKSQPNDAGGNWLRRRGVIPFEPGVGKLSPMTWPWLVGTPVVLFVFIAAVMGFLPSVDANVQLVRRLMSRRAKKPAALPAPTVVMGASPSTGGPSPAIAPCRSVASYMAASSPRATSPGSPRPTGTRPT